MKQIIILLKYELKSQFYSSSTYIASVLFLSLMGFLYCLVLEDFSQSPREGLPTSEFFNLFWLPVFITVPLLTMKSFAEERRMGTLESLLTTPVSISIVVISKFLSAYIFYLIIWTLTLGFPIIAWYLIPTASIDPRILDPASLIGGYTFIAISGFLYVSLGIFSSSLTRSQLVAGMLTFSLLFICLVGGRIILDLPIIDVPSLHWIKIPIDYFQTFQHLEDFSRGIIDSRPFFFYMSSAFLLLTITSLKLEYKA